MTLDLPALRRQLRAQRRALSVGERQAAAAAAAQHVAGWVRWADAARVAGYWACDGELDPAPLLEQAWAAQREVYLPVVLEDRSLGFAPYGPETPLHRNRFNIPEPEAPAKDWLEAVQLDVVLVPLVAFDGVGTRLGMGGGFYDHSFSFLRDAAYRGRRPTLLGLGYDWQKTAALVRRPWDVPLDAAATERVLYVFSDAHQQQDALASP